VGELTTHWTIGPDVPEEGWTEIDLPRLPWRVAMRRAVIQGAPKVIGLQLLPKITADGRPAPPFEPDDLAVTAEALRSLPLATMRDAVLAAEEHRDDPAAMLEAIKRPMADLQRGPRGRLGDDHYLLVARVFAGAARRGDAPLKAVQERWGVSRAMASKYVRGARNRGYLPPPASPGRHTSGETILDPLPTNRRGS
jgi:hypothetical protein